MTIEINELQGVAIAEIISEAIEIKTPQDALDIMANCSYQGARKIIIRDKNITPKFFELKTRLAGEVLQKFSNYQVQLAIVGDFSKYPGKSLRDFIYESNKSRQINFVDSVTKAREVLLIDF
ncbi:MAG: DUF4180 domain-containing protein [Bacteroidales bacterium]|jgi:hypothetical protein